MTYELKPYKPKKTDSKIIRNITIGTETYECPECGTSCKPHSRDNTRTVTELGIAGETYLKVCYYKYTCKDCKEAGRHYTFSHPMEYIVPASSKYSRRVIHRLQDLRSQGKSLEAIANLMRQRHWVRVAPTTVHDLLLRNLEE